MIPFHRLLIGTAILFCAGFAFWTLRAYGETGSTGSLVIGVSFALAAAGLAYYLKNLRRFLRKP